MPRESAERLQQQPAVDLNASRPWTATSRAVLASCPDAGFGSFLDLSSKQYRYKKEMQEADTEYKYKVNSEPSEASERSLSTLPLRVLVVQLAQ